MKGAAVLRKLAARAAVAVAHLSGDDDSELARLAYDRAAKWSAGAEAKIR